MNIKASSDASKSDSRPKPNNFDEFLPWACRQYEVGAEITITKATLKEYISTTTSKHKKHEHKRKRSKPPPSASEVPGLNEDNLTSEYDEDASASNITEDIVNIETVYDANENLVQLKFLKNKIIPRKVIQVIALAISFQKHLTSITITSGLRMDTLYELSKCLVNSQITELCLDGTFFIEADYHILLTHGKLKHLSLARCTINDDGIKTIADQLIDPSPAARVLSALNLSTNRITDVGAKYIADMLRSNRQLSYLNLAGNMITDRGSVSILDTLQKFPLQPQELLKSRGRYVVYLKKRNELIHKFINELQNISMDKIVIRKKTLKRNRLESQYKYLSETEVGARIVQEKAEMLADSELGLFIEPFSPIFTERQDSVVYCLGNNTLCYLNFAYNNLTYVSIKKFLEVLKAQKSFGRTPRGLLKIVIEGNLMPVACEEYEEINHLLESVMNSYEKHTESVIKKRHLSAKSRDTNRLGK